MKSKIRLILREDLDADIEHRDSLNKTGFWGKAGAGAIIIARSTGRLLIPKRSPYVEQPNTWGVWGGAIDPNENPKEAARREIAEECGYTGKIELFPLYVFHAATSDFKYFNFLGVVDDEFTPRLDWETSEAEWFDLTRLPSPLHFGLKAVLNDTDSLNIIQKIANSQLSEQAKIKMVLRENVDKTITCKKCGWHWKESESSDKEMYKCHKCGHDNEPKLKEHLQLADKVYFQSGKLSPEAKLDTAKKILTFGEEPVKVPVKKPQFVDPNQLSLFESLKKKVLKEGMYRAPNGRSSNLNEWQYRLVRTPEFKAWFGDWENDPQNASKVVDENGEPLVCYHETSLENASNLMKTGVFSSGREKAAKFDYGTPYGFFFKKHDNSIGVGETHLTTFLNIRTPLQVESRDDIEDMIAKRSKVYKDVCDRMDYLNDTNDEIVDKLTIKMRAAIAKVRSDRENPEYQAEYKKWEKEKDEFFARWTKETEELSIFAKKVLDKELKSLGYDGVMITRDEGSFGRHTDTKIVFSSKQIKLGDGFNKKFDPNSHDIRSEETELYESLKKKIK